MALRLYSHVGRGRTYSVVLAAILGVAAAAVLALPRLRVERGLLYIVTLVVSVGIAIGGAVISLADFVNYSHRAPRLKRFDTDRKATAALEFSVEADSLVRSRLLILFSAVFLHNVAFAMIGTTLPELQRRFDIDASAIAWVTASIQTGMLGSASVLPLVSDAVGRRPVIAASYIGVGAFMALQALSVHMGLSFRIYVAFGASAGLLAGGSAVVKAYLSDMCSEQLLPAMMSYRDAVSTLAYIVGPSLSGFTLAAAGLEAAVALQSVVSILAGLLIYLWLPAEEPPQTACNRSAIADPAGHQDLGRSADAQARTTAIGVMLAVACLYNVGQSCFDTFFPMLCAEELRFGPEGVGSSLTGLAILVFVGSMGPAAALARRFFMKPVAVTGLLGMAAGLAGLAIPLAGHHSATSMEALRLLAGSVFAISVPLYTPIASALLLRYASPRHRGFVLGLGSAANSAGRTLGPLLFGAFGGAGPAVFSKAAFVVAIAAGLLAAAPGG